MPIGFETERTELVWSFVKLPKEGRQSWWNLITLATTSIFERTWDSLMLLLVVVRISGCFPNSFPNQLAETHRGVSFLRGPPKWCHPFGFPFKPQNNGYQHSNQRHTHIGLTTLRHNQVEPPTQDPALSVVLAPWFCASALPPPARNSWNRGN